MKNCGLKSDDYDEKFIKIKLDSDDKLELPVMVIVVRATFYENNKYYPQAFLAECLYKI